MINEWKESRSALLDGGGVVLSEVRISKQDLNQTLVIPVIFYKLQAVEIVPGSMSVCTRVKKKEKKKTKHLKPRRQGLIISGGGWEKK